jgi:hypothetical protein
MAAKITERTLYGPLMDIIRERGGTGVSEVSFNSEPDIVFTYLEREWICGVKIGETNTVLKQAFIQYQRHKNESGIRFGILLFVPESIRSVVAEEAILTAALGVGKCTCLIDTPNIQTEFKNVTFDQILLNIEQNIAPHFETGTGGYSLEIVIDLLKQHVTDLMQGIRLTDEEMVRVAADKRLLSGIGKLDEDETLYAARFLASYVLLSQILFLRLLSRTKKDLLPADTGHITHHWLRSAFARVLKIDYRPIFELDVLDAVSEEYLQDTFYLIWGLAVEKATVRYELPGRIFHTLMPQKPRKMLAAFYTRPEAAELLARLSIKHATDRVFDPACGSGTILVGAYKRKQQLFHEEGFEGNPHKRFCEEDLFGGDIMPFAVHLTGANLASMDTGTTIDRTQILQGDSLRLSRGYTYHWGIQTTLFPASRTGFTAHGEAYDVALDDIDVICMNPPFTKVERGIRNYVSMERFGATYGNEVGLWGHFIGLAYEFLKEGGGGWSSYPYPSLTRQREQTSQRSPIFRVDAPLYHKKHYQLRVFRIF